MPSGGIPWSPRPLNVAWPRIRATLLAWGLALGALMSQGDCGWQQFNRSSQSPLQPCSLLIKEEDSGFLTPPPSTPKVLKKHFFQFKTTLEQKRPSGHPCSRHVAEPSGLGVHYVY